MLVPVRAQEVTQETSRDGTPHLDTVAPGLNQRCQPERDSSRAVARHALALFLLKGERAPPSPSHSARHAGSATVDGPGRAAADLYPEAAICNLGPTGAAVRCLNSEPRSHPPAALGWVSAPVDRLRAVTRHELPIAVGVRPGARRRALTGESRPVRAPAEKRRPMGSAGPGRVNAQARRISTRACASRWDLPRAPPRPDRRQH